MPRTATSGKQISLLNYAEVQDRMEGHTLHLLLGNGFSISCDAVFCYSSLYEATVRSGLSQRAQEVFERVGINNFEGVMKLLEDTHWVAKRYEGVEASISSTILQDLEIIKKALIAAIGTSHLEHPGVIDEKRTARAAIFLSSYQSVFTTNYDLLLYWVTMKSNPPMFDDGFRSDGANPNSPSLPFAFFPAKAKCMYYLHGALHLFVQEGKVRKQSSARGRQRLTELIRDGLKEQQYPLFVAEGLSKRKLEQIDQNLYLHKCLEKLRWISGHLVIHGHSLSSTDNHILTEISRAPNIRSIFVGLHGDATSAENEATFSKARRLADRRAERGLSNNLFIYDSASAHVWD